VQVDKVKSDQKKSRKNIEDKILGLIPLYLLTKSTDFKKPILDSIKSYQSVDFRQKELNELIGRYSNDLKTQIGLIISVGVKRGLTQSQMLSFVLSWWRNPSSITSSNAFVYHQGKGVTKSAFKNILGVSDSEILLNHRRSDFVAMKDAGGIEVYPSQGHVSDVCDDMFGVYPSDFFFTGIHRGCVCRVRPVKEKITKIPDSVKGLVSKNNFLYKYNTKYFE